MELAACNTLETTAQVTLFITIYAQLMDSDHECCGKECLGLTCNDGCIVYPGGVARSTPELIRAYARGTNRTLLLEEALLSNREDELSEELVDRLFMRPSGEPLEIEGWKEGGEDWAYDIVAFAGLLNRDGPPVLALFVFDEEICMLYSTCSYNSPVDFTVKVCPRTACFEAFARRVHLGEVAAAATPDDDDDWIAHSFPDDYTPFAIDEPLRGTASDVYERRSSWPITHTSTAVDMLLEALFDGRRLVKGGYFFFEDPEAAEGWPPWDSSAASPVSDPGEPDVMFSKIVLHMYLYLLEELEEDLPAPGALRRARNWDVRGAHVLRRALVEKNRATTGQRRKRTRRFEDACFTEFLYATSPAPMFRLILSFL